MKGQTRSTPRQRKQQRSRREKGVEIVFTREETVVGTELDALLRREQTKRSLSYSRRTGRGSKSPPRLRQKKNPAISRVFQKVSSGGGMWTHFPDHLAYRFTEIRRLKRR